MRNVDVPAIQISDPGELIEAVPYLLGFHPFESLVVVGYVGPPRKPRRVQVTMRIDLPSRALRRGEFAELFDALDRNDVSAVTVLWFTDRAAGDIADLWIEARADLLLDEAQAGGIHVFDLLLVSSQRWWSLLCVGADCCPPEGTTRHTSTAVSAAQATFAGLVALPDRHSLAETLRGASVEQRARLLPAIEIGMERAAHEPADHQSASHYVLAFLEAANRFASKPTTPPTGTVHPVALSPVVERTRQDTELVRHAVGLQRLSARDEIWMLIDGSDVDAVALLQWLHTNLPAPYDAPALFLLGWRRWREGNGTVAAMAAERALESDPAYSAAELLLAALRTGLNPHQMPPLGGQLLS